jgi:hypothetical protein
VYTVVLVVVIVVLVVMQHCHCPSSSDEPERNKKTVRTTEKSQSCTERYSYRNIAERSSVTRMTDSDLLEFMNDKTSGRHIAELLKHFSFCRLLGRVDIYTFNNALF